MNESIHVGWGKDDLLIKGKSMVCPIETPSQLQNDEGLWRDCKMTHEKHMEVDHINIAYLNEAYNCLPKRENATFTCFRVFKKENYTQSGLSNPGTYSPLTMKYLEDVDNTTTQPINLDAFANVTPESNALKIESNLSNIRKNAEVIEKLIVNENKSTIPTFGYVRME